MRREIKFRTWDKKNKRMFDGWVLDGSVGNGAWRGGYFGDLDIFVDSTSADVPEREGWYWSSPKDVVLMQFTGLKDRSGYDIYEGDILEIHLPEWNGDGDEAIFEERKVLAEVRINSKSGAKAKVRKIFDEQGNITRLLNINTKRDFIVGNIYETPELFQ